MTLPGFLCVNTRCALRPARHGLHARTHIIWLFWLLWLGCLVMSKPHCRVASFNFMGILLFSFSYCFIHLFFTLAALRVLGNMYLCCRFYIIPPTGALDSNIVDWCVSPCSADSFLFNGRKEENCLSSVVVHSVIPFHAAKGEQNIKPRKEKKEETRHRWEECVKQTRGRCIVVVQIASNFRGI